MCEVAAARPVCPLTRLKNSSITLTLLCSGVTVRWSPFRGWLSPKAAQRVRLCDCPQQHSASIETARALAVLPNCRCLPCLQCLSFWPFPALRPHFPGPPAALCRAAAALFLCPPPPQDVGLRVDFWRRHRAAGANGVCGMPRGCAGGAGGGSLDNGEEQGHPVYGCPARP